MIFKSLANKKWHVLWIQKHIYLLQLLPWTDMKLVIDSHNTDFGYGEYDYSYMNWYWHMVTVIDCIKTNAVFDVYSTFENTQMHVACWAHSDHT